MGIVNFNLCEGTFFSKHVLEFLKKYYFGSWKMISDKCYTLNICIKKDFNYGNNSYRYYRSLLTFFIKVPGDISREWRSLLFVNKQKIVDVITVKCKETLSLILNCHNFPNLLIIPSFHAGSFLPVLYCKFATFLYSV